MSSATDVPRLRVALFQGPPGIPLSRDAILAALDAAAERAATERAEILVCSEMFLTGYAICDACSVAELPDGASFQKIAEIARRHHVGIVYGYPERAEGRANPYNALQFVGPDGTSLAKYRKTQLFGLAEQDMYTPGNEAVVQADFCGVRLGFLICYDMEFPELVRAHALAGTDFLVVPTACMDVDRFVPERMVPVRAFESQLYVAYCNRCGSEPPFVFSGLSCLCAPDGKTTWRAGADEDFVVGEVDLALLRESRRACPYLRDRRPELYRSVCDSSKPLTS